MDSEQKWIAIGTLKELHQCFSSCEPESRVIGNVKAKDAIDAINLALSSIHRADVYYRYNPPI